MFKLFKVIYLTTLFSFILTSISFSKTTDLNIDILIDSLNKKVIENKIIAVTEFNPMENTTDKIIDFSIRELLIEKLLKKTKHTLVEREKLNQAMLEMKIGYEGLVDISKKKQLGEFTGAEAIMSGSYLIRDGKVIIFAKLIEIKTGKILWAESSVKLKEYTDLEKNLTSKIKKNNIKRMAILPFKYLGRNDEIEINYLNDPMTVYAYKSGAADIYERSNLKDLLNEIALIKKGLSKSDQDINLIPVDAFLGGYYYYNRDDDIDIGVDLINVKSSQIIWSDKIYHNASFQMIYENEISDHFRYINTVLKNQPDRSISLVFINSKPDVFDMKAIQKEIFIKDVIRHFVKTENWKVLDRDYIAEIKQEWGLITHYSVIDNFVTQDIKTIGDLTQADGMITIDVSYPTNTDTNIYIRYYHLQSTEILDLGKIKFENKYLPFGFSKKSMLNFSSLPMRTSYWYLQNHSGTLTQAQSGTNLISYDSNGYGIGAMQFIYSYPKKNINTVLFANIDLNGGFQYKNLQNQEVSLINSSFCLEWGLQLFDSYTLTAGLGLAWLNGLQSPDNSTYSTMFGSFYPSFTFAFRTNDLIVALRKYHYQFSPYKNNSIENIHDGLSFIFGFSFGMNDKTYVGE